MLGTRRIRSRTWSDPQVDWPARKNRAVDGIRGGRVLRGLSTAPAPICRPMHRRGRRVSDSARDGDRMRRLIEKAGRSVSALQRPMRISGHAKRILDGPSQESKSLPKIIVNDRQLRDVTSETLDALRRSNQPAHVFTMGTEI